MLPLSDNDAEPACQEASKRPAHGLCSEGLVATKAKAPIANSVVASCKTVLSVAFPNTGGAPVGTWQFPWNSTEDTYAMVLHARLALQSGR
jgi:hypothetical protein